MLSGASPGDYDWKKNRGRGLWSDSNLKLQIGGKGITYRHKNDRKRNKREQDRIKICGFCRVYEQWCMKIWHKDTMVTDKVKKGTWADKKVLLGFAQFFWNAYVTT